MAQLPEYGSILEKREYFTLIEPNGIPLALTTEHQIDQLLSTFSNRTDFVFRGIGNSRYKLFCSAQRLWITNDLGKSFSSYKEFIQEIIALARGTNGKTIDRFFQIMKGKIEDLELLSFIQHYKGPTPLIDFSRNIEVALSFACDSAPKADINEEIDNYISLYILSLNATDEQNTERNFWAMMWETILLSKFNLSAAQKEQFDKGMRSLDVFFEAIKTVSTVYIDSDIMKEFKFNLITSMNIMNQEGVFFFIKDPVKPFEQILEEEFKNGYTKNSKTKWIKCHHIDKNLLPYIKQKLSKRLDYLFPDSYNMMEDVRNGLIRKK